MCHSTDKNSYKQLFAQICYHHSWNLVFKNPLDIPVAPDVTIFPFDVPSSAVPVTRTVLIGGTTLGGEIYINKNSLLNNLFYLSSLFDNWIWNTLFSRASSHGLVVKAEDSWLRGRGFKPPLRRPFFRHHSFGSKAWSKN